MFLFFSGVGICHQSYPTKDWWGRSHISQRKSDPNDLIDCDSRHTVSMLSVFALVLSFSLISTQRSFLEARNMPNRRQSLKAGCGNKRPLLRKKQLFHAFSYDHLRLPTNNQHTEGSKQKNHGCFGNVWDDSKCEHRSQEVLNMCQELEINDKHWSRQRSFFFSSRPPDSSRTANRCSRPLGSRWNGAGERPFGRGEHQICFMFSIPEMGSLQLVSWCPQEPLDNTNLVKVGFPQCFSAFSVPSLPLGHGPAVRLPTSQIQIDEASGLCGSAVWTGSVWKRTRAWFLTRYEYLRNGWTTSKLRFQNRHKSHRTWGVEDPPGPPRSGELGGFALQEWIQLT